jgi:hypothetical protein
MSAAESADLGDQHVSHSEILKAVSDMNKDLGVLKTALETGCVEVSEIKKSVGEVRTEITGLKVNAAEARGAVRMGAWMLGLALGIATIVVAILALTGGNRTEYPQALPPAFRQQ